MKNLSKISNALMLVCLTVGFTQCGGKTDGFSLARSAKQSDYSECMTLLEKKKTQKAIKCLEAYRSRNQGKASAAIADLSVADAYFQQKDYVIASDSYQIFIESHPFHEKIPYAYYKAGLSYLNATPKTVDRDQQYLDSSIRFLETVVKYYGGSPYAELARDSYDQARTKKAKKNYYVGRYYYKAKEFLAAVPRFLTVVTDFPKLGLDEKSFYYLIKSLQKTNQGELASQYFEVFKTHYPDSAYVKRVSKTF